MGCVCGGVGLAAPVLNATMALDNVAWRGRWVIAAEPLPTPSQSCVAAMCSEAAGIVAGAVRGVCGGWLDGARCVAQPPPPALPRAATVCGPELGAVQRVCHVPTVTPVVAGLL